MSFLDVISVGPGHADLLTPAAAKAIAAADCVFCADRLASFVPEPEKRRNLLPISSALCKLRSLLNEDCHAAVLVSGDAGLYSILPMLKNHFGQDELHVIPGISSVQAFCARLRIPWQDACILSAHGRQLKPEALCHYVRTNPKTILLMDQVHTPEWAASTLCKGGLDRVRITIGERIFTPDERISIYQPGCTADPLSLALIENDEPQGLPSPGLPDSAFCRNKTPMTKQEIRIQVLSSLALPIDADVWDIGAGTGSVTVECARLCPLGSVTAVESDKDACLILKENIEQFRLQNVNVLKGTAPEVLRNLPPPTHVFLGGTGGRAGDILNLLKVYGMSIRLCATSVTMESAETYFSLLSGCDGFSAAQIAVSRIEPVGSLHMFRAQNPVFIFSATLHPES